MKKKNPNIKYLWLIFFTPFFLFLCLAAFVFVLSYRQSGLTYAMLSGNPHLVKWAVESGDNVNQAIRSYRWKPIHEAAKNGNVEVIRILLDNGAEIDADEMDDGKTPLAIALEQMNFDAAKLLIKRGADVKLAVENHRLQNRKEFELFLRSLKNEKIDKILSGDGEINNEEKKE